MLPDSICYGRFSEFCEGNSLRSRYLIIDRDARENEYTITILIETLGELISGFQSIYLINIFSCFPSGPFAIAVLFLAEGRVMLKLFI